MAEGPTGARADSEGCVLFAPTQDSIAWAEAALVRARAVLADPEAQRANLRHGKTWFVGVDALANDGAGAVDGVPLAGDFMAHLPDTGPLHRAQLSVIYPGYPRQDPDQSDANHRYRVERCAAHVDGLLPIGPERRRYPREFHAYVLGIHLNACEAAPTVYWRGSHRVMERALRDAIGDTDPCDVDVTEAYQTARREVFATCEAVAITGAPGGAFLLHRLCLHGTAPWAGPDVTEGRITAFFRLEFRDRAQWLAGG